MSGMVDIIINTGIFLLNTFLAFNVFFLLFFSIAGHFPAKKFRLGQTYRRRMCLLVPAYKADDVVLETAPLLLQHQYSGTFTVFVIADGLLASTRKSLREKGIQVIEVDFQNSTKGKALATAIELIPENQYDVAVVLDVDNQMSAEFLEQVNDGFDSGFEVVQGHRVAKNLHNSTFSYLDGCNEEINNHIFRKGHFAIGVSPALIGSGMAFSFKYFKHLMRNVGETVGEDKELEFKLSRDGTPICYLNDALVFDEKVESAHVFTNQRTRWIATQVEFLKKYLREVCHNPKVLMTGFGLKMLEYLILPRVLLAGVLSLLFLIAAVIPDHSFLLFWGMLLLFLFIALLLALPRRYYNFKLAMAVANLPIALFCMIKALFTINKAKSSFLVTPHSTNIRPREFQD